MEATTDKAEQILKIYNQVLNKILLYAEASLPDKNYQAFRKLVIKEFGHGGAKDKVTALMKGK